MFNKIIWVAIILIISYWGYAWLMPNNSEISNTRYKIVSRIHKHATLQVEAGYSDYKKLLSKISEASNDNIITLHEYEDIVVLEESLEKQELLKKMKVNLDKSQKEQ